MIRQIAKDQHGMLFLRSLLAHKRVMLYFTQPSTRTFLSFLNACHILGIQSSEIRDPQTSSEYKGEDLEDAIRTFSSYVDMIIMRTKREGVADLIAQHLDQTDRPVPIINALLTKNPAGRNCRRAWDFRWRWMSVAECTGKWTPVRA